MNLEKMMFFVPNRLYIKGNRMLVSFNIAVIPTDMVVTSMMLHIPIVNRLNHAVHVIVQPLASGWDENLAAKGYVPDTKGLEKTILVSPGTEEVQVDLTHHQQEWRFQSVENHGLKVKSRPSSSRLFSEEDPPYLIVATL